MRDVRCGGASNELARHPVNEEWLGFSRGRRWRASAGDTASALAIEILRPMMPKLQSDRDVQLAVNAADAALFVAMQLRPDLNGMGTTIAGVVLKQDGAIAFNAGDSRVYAFEQGELHQVSTDDTTIGGELLQCLGGYQEPSPMFVHSRWVGAHSTLIICSDGLTAVVSEATIVKTLLRGVDDPAAALVDAAIAAGAPDNVTVAVIMPQRGSS